MPELSQVGGPLPPLFDLAFCGNELALREAILPFLAKIIGDRRTTVCTVVFDPVKVLGIPLKTAEKGIRRINDKDHQGLCPFFTFSVKDMNVCMDEPRRPGMLRITATPTLNAPVSPQGSLFE